MTVVLIYFFTVFSTSILGTTCNGLHSQARRDGCDIENFQTKLFAEELLHIAEGQDEEPGDRRTLNSSALSEN